jgi:hypothetical protein
MWFDVRAKLAEIESCAPATNWAKPARHVAEVANVAMPLRVKSENAPPARADGLGAAKLAGMWPVGLSEDDLMVIVHALDKARGWA